MIKHFFKATCLMAVLALVAMACQENKQPANTPTTEETDTTTMVTDSVQTPVEEVDSDSIAQARKAEKEAEAILQRYEREGGNRQHAGNNSDGRKVIYLTFDDGPSTLTPRILNILKENDVHATFFVVGHHSNCLKYIRRAYEEGNAIAAHSYTHNYSIYKNMDTYFDDLEKIEKVIEEQTGQRTPIIRFPGGSSNIVHYKHSQDSLFMIRLTQAVRDKGYQYVDWNISSMDATGFGVPVQTIIKSSCRNKHNDLCLLMHDTYGKETTVEALPTIIQYYKEQGYEFGTLTDQSYVCHHAVKPYSGKKKTEPLLKTTSPAKAKNAQPTAVEAEATENQAPAEVPVENTES